MENFLTVIPIAALFFLATGCEEPPKDSIGHTYEFRCEKRPECNNEDGLVQIAYEVKDGKPDPTKFEEIVFCCDQLAQSIDSLKKYKELIGPFNDSLKGRVLTDEEYNAMEPPEVQRKFGRAFYFSEDSICIDLSPVFIVTTRTFKEMRISVGKKNTSRIWLIYTGGKELDRYIELLEDNYKNCCI